MENKQLSIFIGEKIKYYRHLNKMTQTELADKLGVAKTTVSGYEKGYRSPMQSTLFKIADVFDISIDDLFPKITQSTPTQATNELVQAITDKTTQLTTPRQEAVLEYATEQLDEQEREIQEQTTLYEVETVTQLAAGLGYSYDDNEIQTVQVEEEPPRYDLASLVNGDSMLPDYEDGDVVYLKDTGFSSYSGQVCAIAINDKSYLKKVYTEEDGLRLVSINKDYKDIFIDFPPSPDTHIKIYAVIGSDKVVGV